MKDNYLRLDFNKDGSVSMDDLRTSLIQFYDFLKSYDYIQATTVIRSSLYDQAVNMMRKGAQSEAAAAPEGQAQEALAGDGRKEGGPSAIQEPVAAEAEEAKNVEKEEKAAQEGSAPAQMAQ